MKRLIKGVAAKHGLIASFMAKPFENEAGNGMHVHCSVLDETGNNIFNDDTEKGSDLLRNAIAGCLRYMPDSVAILAPTFNAYRRFQPGCHAPTFPSWGYENRTVAVRVPAGNNSARRLEHRVAGADANPYLLFAVLLSGMLEGIKQSLDPGEPIHGDGYSQETEPLPAYQQDAVQLFKESDFIRSNLGSEIQRIYSLTKEQEIAEFRRRITTLEYQSYLEQL
jgi:glutamine synthetase